MKTKLFHAQIDRLFIRLLCYAALILSPACLSAQQFELLGGTVGGAAINTNAAVTKNVPVADLCNPKQPGPRIRDRQWNGNNFVPGAFLQNIPNLADPNKPWDLFYHFNLTAEVDGAYRVGSGTNTICDCLIQERKQHESMGQSMMFLAANGDQTGELFIQWRNVSKVSTRNTDQSGSADGKSTSNLSIDFKITGLPDNTPVDVHFRYNSTALGWTSHEGAAEDPISLELTNLSLAGIDLIPVGTNPDAHALYDVDGSATLLAGTAYTLNCNATTSARIAAPSTKLNGYCLKHYIDSAFSQVMGKVVLSFSPVVRPLSGSPAHSQGCPYDLVYSVDIGSTAETSTPPGGGPLDPGDLYPRGYALGGANPGFYRDDAAYFAGVDPAPDPVAAGSQAPVAQGVPIDLVRDLFFNVDAAALLPFDPTTLNYGPGQPALTRAAVQAATGAAGCIVPPRWVLLSERDSAMVTYPSSAPGGAPFNSIAPGGPHGTTSGRDEVVQYEFPAHGGGIITGPDRLYDEFDFDPVLAPNPDGPMIGENDDVNALAVAQLDPARGNCADFTCFSVSAEARYGLHPGVLYVAPAGGGAPVAAVTPDHLGLPWSVDLDAAEFTWWVDPASGQASLALLFSVAEDLHETPEDESGGREPARVYVSFLNGGNVSSGLAGTHDVDAIAVIPCRAAQPPRIQTTTLPDGEVCSFYAASLGATGGFGMVHTWAVTSGALPPGLSLHPHTGEITGVPTADGVFSFEVTATDPLGLASQGLFNLTIDPPAGPPAINAQPLPDGTPGLPYHEQVTHRGGCQPVYLTVSGGQLPPGLMLDVVSGVISGIPRASGLFAFDLEARDTSGAVATASFTIDITGSAPPAIGLTQTVFGPFVPGQAFTLKLDAMGGTPPYQYFVNSLPAGFTLTGDTITGTASASPAIVGIDVDIVDAQFHSGSAAIHHLVLSPQPGDPQLQPLPSQDWVVGQVVDVHPVVAGGTPPLTFSWAHGQPPSGLGLSPSTGRIHGIPNGPESGMLPLLVTDANGSQDAVAVPYVIHAGFPGGYPAWKTHHGVALDSEDLEPDSFPAIGEYFMGIDPAVRDPSSLYQLQRLPNGLMHLDFPAAGVLDVSVQLQRLDPATHQWHPFYSNPFPPFDPGVLLRLKFEHP